ncbi:Ferrochelatase [Sinobacterium norvegicum]|uniref:Ferrochelatase n=1 Tax=Sinobacterium norvegicum TaxID=1641715 RepID=A0ABM9ABR2_9GAMM|nr:ferrochelatase [Sinobacterium norvegicum]CAH0990405.1 Ferrochelatase [Sinobacterium norvegicum]
MSTNTKKAIILVNLGSPEQPTVSGVRAFLKPFLSDKRVVEVPKPIWWLILNGVILPFRPKKVAQAYQSIWWQQGSPLRAILQQQQEALQQRFDSQQVRVLTAMTYGAPSVESQIHALQQEGIEKIVILPLYPQYSATTTAAVTDQVCQMLQRCRDIPDLRIVKSYYQHPGYIAALAESVSQYWQLHGKAEHLLMSFHGIPQANVDKGDPYYDHCLATAEAVADKLGLAVEDWTMSFQSRLGRAQWLTPYTADTLQQYGPKKIKTLDVICPAFSADCLETLEEMAIENKEIYQQAGGGEYRYIAALNSESSHIDMMEDICQRQLQSFID